VSLCGSAGQRKQKHTRLANEIDAFSVASFGDELLSGFKLYKMDSAAMQAADVRPDAAAYVSAQTGRELKSAFQCPSGRMECAATLASEARDDYDVETSANTQSSLEETVRNLERCLNEKTCSEGTGLLGESTVLAELRDALPARLAKADDSELELFFEIIIRVLPKITNGFWDGVIAALLTAGVCRSTTNKIAFRGFVTSLVLQDVQYLEPVVSFLVQSFPTLSEDGCGTVHDVLSNLISLIPRTEECYLFYLEKYFPHASRPEKQFIMYVRMLLCSLSYAKTRVSAMLSLLFRRLVILELEYLAALDFPTGLVTSPESFVEKHLSDDGNHDISVFELGDSERTEASIEQDSSTLVDPAIAELSAESLSKKLDTCLDEVFLFCSQITRKQIDTFLDALYVAFEAHVMPVATSRRVPFILFVFLSHSGSAALELILRHLLTFFFDTGRPLSSRSLAVLNAGALVASNAAANLLMALPWMKTVSSWLHNQLDRAYTSHCPELHSFGEVLEEPVYAGMTGVLYVLGAYASLLSFSDFYREQVRRMRLGRLIHMMPNLMERIPLELLQAITTLPEFAFVFELFVDEVRRVPRFSLDDLMPFRVYGLPRSEQHVRDALRPFKSANVISSEEEIGSQLDDQEIALALR
jgi:hypothetical protein